MFGGSINKLKVDNVSVKTDSSADQSQNKTRKVGKNQFQHPQRVRDYKPTGAIKSESDQTMRSMMVLSQWTHPELKRPSVNCCFSLL